MPVPT